MYAVKDGESKEVTRHQRSGRIAGVAGVLWCPWCDTSSQDHLKRCPCGAEFLAAEPGQGRVMDVHFYDHSLTDEDAMVIASQAIINHYDSYHTPATEPPILDPEEELSPNTCPDCLRVFKSPSGVRLHRRRVH